MFKGLFQFLKSKTFLLNAFIYVVLVAIILWMVSLFLSSVTRHGKTIKVPDFKNLKIGELDQFSNGKNVNYLIIDSIYSPKSPRGVVIRQEPEAGSDVKENRKIYLYVTSILPPTIQMPKLIDRSLRQASSMIESYQLKLGKVQFVADQCANCVLEQLVKGKKIAPGQPISKGTVINLVVGKGLSEEEVGVPCLYGLTRKEAIEKLAEASLSVGIIKFDVPKDSVNSKVYQQQPACGRNKNMGSTVDLFFTTDQSKIPSADQLNQPEETKEVNFDE